MIDPRQRTGGWGRVAPALRVALALIATGCGYRSLHGSPGTGDLAVIGAAVRIVDVALLADVEAGVRTGLARAGALRSGTEGYPRVVVEVLRVDRVSEGVVALPGGRTETAGGLPPGSSASLPLAPLARGTRIGVVGRAWIERAPGGARERDTGDVRASDTVSVETSAVVEALREDDATRASARRLGERLARIVLGYPDASDEAM